MSSVTESERVVLERLRSGDKQAILLDSELSATASLVRKGLVVRGFIGSPVRARHYLLTLRGEQVALGRIL